MWVNVSELTLNLKKIPTQLFYVESLSELTPERFEGEIKRQKRYEFNGIKPKQTVEI